MKRSILIEEDDNSLQIATNGILSPTEVLGLIEYARLQVQRKIMSIERNVSYEEKKSIPN